MQSSNSGLWTLRSQTRDRHAMWFNGTLTACLPELKESKMQKYNYSSHTEFATKHLGWIGIIYCERWARKIASLYIRYIHTCNIKQMMVPMFSFSCYDDDFTTSHTSYTECHVRHWTVWTGSFQVNRIEISFSPSSYPKWPIVCSVVNGIPFLWQKWSSFLYTSNVKEWTVVYPTQLHVMLVQRANFYIVNTILLRT